MSSFDEIESSIPPFHSGKPLTPNYEFDDVSSMHSGASRGSKFQGRDSSIATSYSESPRPFDIQELTREEVGNVWAKLRECSFSDGKLDSDDAYEILCLISSLVRADVTKTYDEVSESFMSIIGQDVANTIDEDNLRHLVTTYSKMVGSEKDPTCDENELDKIVCITSRREESAEHEAAAINLDAKLEIAVEPTPTTSNESAASLGSTSKSEGSKSDLSKDDVVLLERLRLSGEAVLLLGRIRDWHFDIFQLQSLTPYPLVAVAEAAINELNLIFSMELRAMKLRRFLVEISDAYLPNLYHNQLHAADVTQTMFHFLTTCRLARILGLNNLAVLAMLLSASIHDVAHPGVTGKYLIAVDDPLAIEYNDSSPLENMHLATAFASLRKPENNFLDKFSKSIYREFRRMCIEMVLSTDNDRHFTLMEKVESLINSGEAVMSNPTPLKSHTPRLSKCRSAFIFPSVLNSPGSGDQLDSGDGKSVTPLSAEHHSRRRNSDTVTNTVTFSLPSAKGNDATDNSVHASLSAASRCHSTRMLPVSSVAFSPNMKLSTSSASPLLSAPSTASATTNISAVTEARQLLLMQLALHAADVSNPVKPWEQHLAWYPRLMEEFFLQGDKERELGYPITYAFDRHNSVSQPKFQLGFLRAIVGPLYKTFARIPGLNISHCLESIDKNVNNWEQIASSEYGENLRDPNKVQEIVQILGIKG